MDGNNMRYKQDQNGVAAIYDETVNGDAPFDDPLGHLPAVRFHSDLNYVAVEKELTGTLVLPSRNLGVPPNNLHAETHILAAHNMGFQPWVYGEIQILHATNFTPNEWVPFSGSVPVLVPEHNISAATGWGKQIWMTLGANSTHVLIHELVSTCVDTTGGFTWNSFSFAYKIWVTNMNLDG